MRGSIWSVVALGAAAAMAPAILDVQVSAGSTGDDILGLLTIFDPLLGLAFVIVAFGLLLTYFSDSGF
jgi:hypothetical protein